MSEIFVDRECLYNDANRIIQHLNDLTLPELGATNCCNFACLDYYQAIYYQFKHLIDVYKRVLSRDVCVVTDMAIAFIEYDNFCANLTESDHWFPEIEADLNDTDVSLESYESVAITFNDSYWDYSFDTMGGIIAEIVSNLGNCIDSLDHMRGYIHRLRDTEGFRGEAASATLRFFNSNHVNCVCALSDSLVLVQDCIANHYSKYDDIHSNDVRCAMSKEELDSFICSLNDQIDTINNLETSLIAAHDEVRVASGTDYSAFLPDKSRIINLCEETISATNSIIDYVNDTEEVFFLGQVQPDCDTALATCFDIVQTVITNAGRYQYINPDSSVDPLGIGARYIELNSLCYEVNLNYGNAYDNDSIRQLVNDYRIVNSEGESIVERGRNYLGVDREGIMILALYCLGYGNVEDNSHLPGYGIIADHYCEGLGGHNTDVYISNPAIGQYMMADESLKCFVRRIIDGYISPADPSQEISVGETIPIDYTGHMEIENGEGIVGYQFLHGTVDSVGDFHITGSIYRQSEDVYVCDLTCTWNDQIDPNGTYGSDTLKSLIAEIVFMGEPEPYDIHITWDSQTVIDVNTSANSTGWLRTPAEDFPY